jgi:hypothetical protein
VFVAITGDGRVIRAETQRGGTATLFLKGETTGTNPPDEAGASPLAALMSSGPDRPEPLAQFVVADGRAGLVTGHRLPNAAAVSGRPLNAEILAGLHGVGGSTTSNGVMCTAPALGSDVGGRYAARPRRKLGPDLPASAQRDGPASRVSDRLRRASDDSGADPPRATAFRCATTQSCPVVEYRLRRLLADADYASDRRADGSSLDRAGHAPGHGACSARPLEAGDRDAVLRRTTMAARDPHALTTEATGSSRARGTAPRSGRGRADHAVAPPSLAEHADRWHAEPGRRGWSRAPTAVLEPPPRRGLALRLPRGVTPAPGCRRRDGGRCAGQVTAGTRREPRSALCAFARSRAFPVRRMHRLPSAASRRRRPPGSAVAMDRSISRAVSRTAGVSTERCLAGGARGRLIWHQLHISG